MFQNICIIGAGLLGGSLAMKLKKNSPDVTISTYARSPEKEQQIRNTGIFDRISSNIEDTVRYAELIVLCTPVDTFETLLSAMLPTIKQNAIVTDVGSTKSHVCNISEKILSGKAFFIGAHPMAGSEKAGINHAKEDLFEEQTCFITPTPKSDSDALQKVESLWKSAGMNTVITSPHEHDRIVANISHLPHILAATLCKHLSQKTEWLTYSGNGLRDTTRIASGLPELWQSILLSNRETILESISQFQEQLNEIKTALSENDKKALLDFLSLAKTTRDRF